ncbi:MAG: efflux RND transporter permease subunit, partial [Bacteroidota bacterium]
MAKFPEKVNERGSSFRICISFLLLSLLGYVLLPRISFQLEPSRSLPELTITYSWQNASPELIEQQVTAKLEGVFSSIKELKSLKSSTYPGRGEILIAFDKGTDLDLRRYEVSTLIRRIIKDLPEAVSYPEISLGSVEEDRKGPILSYTIVGDQSPYDIQQYGENIIAPELAQIEGVKNIKIYGANPFAWELAYDPDQLRSLGLNREELASGIENNFLEESLDEDYSFKAKGSRLRQGFPGLTFSLQDSLSQRVLSSKELLQIQRKERPPNAYFRINGQNA